MLKKYFLGCYNLTGDLTIELSKGVAERFEAKQDDCTTRLADTGQMTSTGGRVRCLRRLLDSGTFMAAYGDGVANIDLPALLAFHKRQGRIAIVTAVRPPARSGGISFDGDLVAAFTEKPQAGETIPPGRPSRQDLLLSDYANLTSGFRFQLQTSEVKDGNQELVA